MANRSYGTEAEDVRKVSLSSLVVKDDDNARFLANRFNTASASSDDSALLQSIQKNGVLEPLLVMESGDRLVLVAGFRRYHAANAANLQTIDVKMVKGDPALINLAENVARRAFTASEVAFRAHTLWKGGKSQAEIGESIGLSNQMVSDYCRIVDRTNPEILAYWRGRPGDISVREMIRYSGEDQTEQMRIFMAGGWRRHDQLGQRPKKKKRHQSAARIRKRGVIQELHVALTTGKYSKRGRDWERGATEVLDFVLRLADSPAADGA